MSTNYVVSWSEETWLRVCITADTKEEAKEKFWAGQFDMEEAKNIGGEIQDSVEVWPADSVLMRVGRT